MHYVYVLRSVKDGNLYTGYTTTLYQRVADHAAGNANPVGADTAVRIEPLDCSIPCVSESAGEVTLNPDWIEP